MLKENWRFIARIERLGDFLIVILAFLVAYYGRESMMYWNQTLNLSLPFEPGELAPITEYFNILLASVLCTLGILEFRGAYGSMRFISSAQLLLLFSTTALLVFFSLASILFILKIDLSRSFIGLFCLLLTLGLTFERILVLKVLRFIRSKGYNFRNILIIGINSQSIKLIEQIINRPELGVRIKAVAKYSNSLNEDVNKKFNQIKRTVKESQKYDIGNLVTDLEETEKILNSKAIDEVIFGDFSDNSKKVKELVGICTEQGVRTTIAADLFSIGLIKSGISHFGDVPLIHFQPPPGDRWELSLKRFIDLTISFVLIVLLIPVFIVLSILVKIDSKGPILFRQRRVGLNGRIFTLYKFRSMVEDAERKLDKLTEKNTMQGPAFKIEDDPRITKFGKSLRKFSLDELPQLFNVLKGEMSLVGPRPPIPKEVKEYARHYRRRLSMRPGITCIWQVSGRNKINDFESWLKLDLEYIDNWSLFNDFKILIKTIPAVIFGIGAS